MMRRKDVPQDPGLFGEWKEVSYAVDDDGRYVLVTSAGWEPANIANHMAWESIEAEVRAVLAQVRAGKLSPLAYQMARHQLDPGLLAGYAGLFRWQVRRHMKPAAFRRISSALADRYAAIFRITREELMGIPEGDSPAGARK
jgi:PHD/YefM family antitoxin component YafN of YafNO toxin-antitoxin module